MPPVVVDSEAMRCRSRAEAFDIEEFASKFSDVESAVCGTNDRQSIF